MFFIEVWIWKVTQKAHTVGPSILIYTHLGLCQLFSFTSTGNSWVVLIPTPCDTQCAVPNLAVLC